MTVAAPDGGHVDCAAAVLALQAELPRIHKGNTGTIPGKDGKQGYSYKYADLGDLTDALQPLLTKHGLTFVSRPTVEPGVGFVLAYALTHADSHTSIEGMYPLPDPARVTAQQVGSAITYGRRYCLGCVTGVVPDEDEDGRVASTTTAQTPHDAPRTPQSPEEYLQLLRESSSPAHVRTLARDLALDGYAASIVEVPTREGLQTMTLEDACEARLTYLQKQQNAARAATEGRQAGDRPDGR